MGGTSFTATFSCGILCIVQRLELPSWPSLQWHFFQGFSTSAVRPGPLGVVRTGWNRYDFQICISIQNWSTWPSFNKGVSRKNRAFQQLEYLWIEFFFLCSCYQSLYRCICCTAMFLMKVAPGITTMWNWFEMVRKKDTDPGDRMYSLCLPEN